MRLVEATEAMAQGLDRATWTTWGGPLPLEAYLALVGRLRNHPWPRAVLSTWILASDEGTALASCQAYRMDSRSGATPGHAYGIGSVFTEPAHRRRGLAATLLDDLAAHLAARDPAAQACFLFTEATTTPYLRAGFRPRPLETRAFPAEAGDPSAPVDALLAGKGDAELPAGLPWPPGPFAIRPSADQFDWQWERERILLEVLGWPPPPARGARAGAGLALWAADPHRRGLALLHFQAGSPGEAAALLEAARRTARACGLPRVLLWIPPQGDPGGGLPPGGPAAPGPPPGGPQPMIRPLRPGIQPGDWHHLSEAIRI